MSTLRSQAFKLAFVAFTAHATPSSAASPHDPPNGMTGFGGNCAREALSKKQPIPAACAAELAKRLGYANMRTGRDTVVFSGRGTVVFSDVARDGAACARMGRNPHGQWSAIVVRCPPGTR